MPLRSERTRRHDLIGRFGSDAALGVVYDEELEISVLPDGGQASSCSDCAVYICGREPNSIIYGFWSADNPTWAGASLVDGHTFAVVDERYIVDPWAVETEALSARAVFDLEDPADAAEIGRLYGNPLKWTQLDEPTEAAITGGRQHDRGRASRRLPGSLTAEELRQLLHPRWEQSVTSWVT